MDIVFSLEESMQEWAKDAMLILNTTIGLRSTLNGKPQAENLKTLNILFIRKNQANFHGIK